MSLLSKVKRLVKSKKCANCGELTDDYETVIFNRMQGKSIQGCFCKKCAQKQDVRELFKKYLAEKGIINNDGLQITGKWENH